MRQEKVVMPETCKWLELAPSGWPPNRVYETPHDGMKKFYYGDVGQPCPYCGKPIEVVEKKEAV